jgi:protein-S-isoprenylcysteine O-methyltransferase Ste14
MLTRLLFYTAVLIGYLYISIILWSIVRPQHRIWPPGRISWKFYLTWGAFYLAVGLAAALFILDWNTWRIPSEIRFGIGAPLAVLGLGLVTWGIYTLGIENTHGLRDGFIARGPYKFTRNPQYLGDIVMLAGLILIINSALLAVINLLIILSFIMMPFAEELWLEEQYGEAYLRYKMQTPRFL